MRIIYFGDGPWAHESLKLLVEKGYDVALVVVRNDHKDTVLIEMAKSMGIEGTWHENVNSSDFVEQLKNLNADLAISMSFNQIIKKELMNLFSKGFINCHAGKLPFYRGRNILNWALINDEKEIGVTCHYIDKGIDTGDIIVQQTFPVTDDDDYGTVLKKAIKLCPEVLLKGVGLIQNGQVIRTKQPLAGTYFPARKNGDEYIDWSWPSRQVFNFIRAITTPGPCARTWLRLDDDYVEVVIKKAKLIDAAINYSCIHGAVIARTDSGNPFVKTGNNYIELIEYELINCPRKGLQANDRLGISINRMIR